MTRLRIVLGLCCVLLCCFRVVAVEPDELLKAKFVARFVQMTQWPPPPPSQFRYCVAGNPSLLHALQQTKLYSSHGEPLLIEAIEHPSQSLDCQLLVLSIETQSELTIWQEQLSSLPLLVITDHSEAFQSIGIIGLVTEPDGYSFRINHSLALQRGLKLSSQLLKLAREVR